MADDDIDATVRSRLRSLRLARGWSLDDLATRSHLSASTISRVETGKRTISLDVLLPLCRALQLDLNTLLAADDDEDVVIRPLAVPWGGGGTAWPLTRGRSANGIVAAKVRLEPSPHPDAQVHPGHDWFFVLSGAVRLTLGDRRILVQAGEAAEFSTMTPHAFSAHEGPAELITIFDRDGQHAHLHVADGSAPA